MRASIESFEIGLISMLIAPITPFARLRDVVIGAGIVAVVVILIIFFLLRRKPHQTSQPPPKSPS